MDVKISKYLSHLLRHGNPETLQMTDDGYVRINHILSLQQSKFYKLNESKIREIVDKNDKKRFEISQSPNGEMLIRACQGHSIKKLDDSKMMTEITDPNEYSIIVHGTYMRNWERIRVEGLKKMNRNHIHFAIGYPNDKEVISGMRSTCEIFIEIDLQRALNDGIKFYLSTNKVILTSGMNGVLSPLYFKTVKNSHGKAIC